MTWLDVAFRSGMSSRSDLRGAVDAGVPVGVVAGELSTAALLLVLPHYLDSGGYVFVDSGAFGAFKSGKQMEWANILSCYKLLASMTDRPGNLYIVAPDVVGDQAQTLALLDTWAADVRELMAVGCQVIVPIQIGALSGQEMIERVSGILGTTAFVAGVPSNRAAMSVAECAALCHHAFHILGRVQGDEEQQIRVYGLRAKNPAARVTADANWLRSRLKNIQVGTESVRKRRRNEHQAAFDNPRAEAVSHLLRSDLAWAAAPIQGANEQVPLLSAA